MRFMTLTVMALALPIAACGDIQGPIGETDIALARGGNSTTTTLTTDATVGSGAVNDGPITYAGDVPPATITHSADAPPLQTYRTSFTAIQGEGNTFVVFYRDPWTSGNNQGDWYLKIDIPSDAELLNENGVPVPVGEAVEITVELDSTRFFVQFGPHGSTFLGRKPALLHFNLRYADYQGLDLDALQVWYQPNVAETWTAQPTEVNAKKHRLLMYLDHFSNYAVAW